VEGTDGSFGEFVRANGLEITHDWPGAMTPLLARGEGDKYFRPQARGKLPGGLEGTIARYRYSSGQSFTFNVIVAEIPEATPFVPRLTCDRRGRHETNIHYGFEIRSDKVWQESVALNDRYRITTSAFQDENWMRQLFAPALIAYLADEPPKSFAFELAYGTFCASIEEDDPPTEALDAFSRAASHVALAIRAECTEGPG
jgi:hypothetical protein